MISTYWWTPMSILNHWEAPRSGMSLMNLYLSGPSEKGWSKNDEPLLVVAVRSVVLDQQQFIFFEFYDAVGDCAQLVLELRLVEEVDVQVAQDERLEELLVVVLVSQVQEVGGRLDWTVAEKQAEDVFVFG